MLYFFYKKTAQKHLRYIYLKWFWAGVPFFYRMFYSLRPCITAYDTVLSEIDESKYSDPRAQCRPYVERWVHGNMPQVMDSFGMGFAPQSCAIVSVRRGDVRDLLNILNRHRPICDTPELNSVREKKNIHIAQDIKDDASFENIYRTAKAVVDEISDQPWFVLMVNAFSAMFGGEGFESAADLAAYCRSFFA